MKVLSKKDIIIYKQKWLEASKSGALNGEPDKPRTIELKDYYFDLYKKRFEELGVTSNFLDTSSIRDVIYSIPVKNHGTRKQIYDNIRSFTKFLVQIKVMDKADREQIKDLRPRRLYPVKRICAREENVELLLKSLWESLHRSNHNKCLLDLCIKLAACCGLRRAETVNLKLPHVNLPRAELFIELGKGYKNRKLGAPQIVLDSLKKYLEIRPECETDQLLVLEDGRPLTIKHYSQTFKRLATSAGLDITPHSLRRFFVTSNAERGVPLVQLQMACGHSSISTTELYVMPDVEKTVEMMKKL